MNKHLKLYLAAWVVLVVLFNLFCFLVPDLPDGGTRFTGAFRVGYACVMCGFALHLFYSSVVLREKNAAKRVLNTPLYVISFAGLLLQTAVGAYVILAHDTPAWLAVLLCAAVPAVSALLFIAAKATGEVAHDANVSLNEKTSFMRSLTDLAQQLTTACTTPEDRQLAQKVFDALRYSDPVSSPATAGDEQRIHDALTSLAGAVGAGTALTERSSEVSALLALIERRNAACKAAKRQA